MAIRTVYDAHRLGGRGHNPNAQGGPLESTCPGCRRDAALLREREDAVSRAAAARSRAAYQRTSRRFLVSFIVIALIALVLEVWGVVSLLPVGH